MAEIKLNDSFETEVNAFRASGSELDSVDIAGISTGVLNLPAVSNYQNRIIRIKTIMNYFMLLIEKDADDMDALALRLRTADNASGGGRDAFGTASGGGIR